jgi:hypothetical protein
MSLPIEKSVLVIIFLMSGQAIGQNIILENELRFCCDKYKANSCTNTDILCNGKYLHNLRDELAMNDQQLKEFCDC